MQLEEPLRRRRRLSLTPLIDVVFILLIFFMLASTFTTEQILTVEAPGERVSAPSEESPALLRVQVAGSGFIIDETPLSGTEVRERLERFAAEEDEPRLQIVAHADAPVQPIVQVIDWSAALGLDDVALLRQEAP
ncbi:hypothetical protein CKO15_11455 [Halorhodospira abdelmalekii]|uniref:ExbD/TolR family protein n=1 Tax=Halorhodospira abdelmalekii TaxID=421629 RepID=UPI00190571C5|nr:biopolymer transporter ExbD [Halorhodospira abdelmalekii]MBK1735883.1 hypothetical protein [Halorhodospira abdelmalekii]